MRSYRQFTAIATVVSASIFYLWYRYYRKRTLSRSIYHQAYTQMALESFLCCGPLRKRKKDKAKIHAPYQKDLSTSNSKSSHSENTYSHLHSSEERVEVGVVEPVVVPDCTAVIGVVPIEGVETTSELLVSEESCADEFSVTYETKTAPTVCQVHPLSVADCFESVMQTEIKSLSSTAEPVVRMEVAEGSNDGFEHDGVVTHIPNNLADADSLLADSPENSSCDKSQQDVIALETDGQCELTAITSNGSVFCNTALSNAADSSEGRTGKGDPADLKLDTLSIRSDDESVAPINIRNEFEVSANSSVEDGPEDEGSTESGCLEKAGLESPPGNLPVGIFDDPENDITECPPELYNGEVIPCVSVPDSMFSELDGTGLWSETYEVPAYLGGVIIGRLGKNVRELKETFNADMNLQDSNLYQGTLHLKITCPKEHKDAVNEWVMKRMKSKPSLTTIGTPNQLVRMLPLGQLSHVMVRSMYGRKDVFVSLIDKDYKEFWRMQIDMNRDYSELNSPRMQLYEPITSGTIAVVPSDYGFCRAVIIKIFNKVYPKKVMCFLLDHGVFAVVSISELRKIRARYMRICFQAIHVDWAHAMPSWDFPEMAALKDLFGSCRWRTYAFAVRNITCCRQSVVFLEDPSGSQSDAPVPPPTGATKMLDILAKGIHLGYYRLNHLLVIEERQRELNGTDTPYYFFQHSDMDYRPYVRMVSEFYLENQQMRVDGRDKGEQHQQDKGGTGPADRRSPNRNGHRRDNTNSETSNQKGNRRRRKPASRGQKSKK